MLIVRKKQMEKLNEVLDYVLIERIAAHLNEMHPEHVREIPHPVLLQRIRHGVLTARGYGFELDSSVMVFVSLMFTVAPNFDSEPAIRQVLSDERIPEAYRFDILMTQTGEEEWESAVMHSDDKAWGD